MDDRSIIELYLARAEEATRRTEEKYGALCHSIAYGILGNKEDAEECVNDAYLAVWNRIPPEIPNSFVAFIAKITRNISLDRFDYNTAACRNTNAAVVLDEIAEFLPDTEDDFSASLLMQEINAFLAGQMKQARCIFVRRYFYCESIADIAKRYGMSESAVKSSLFRTRSRLASRLRKGRFL